jgi:uncharacterized membrane protein required for colicin V production
MGLDLALGVIVLLAAIRGWLKGFILQAIRLAGLVACVYAADPVRDLARPYVLPHLPSIRPDLGDRLLWWSAAVVSYIVLVGLATSIHKFSQRQAFGIAEPKRNDQYAGFALGALKGTIAVLFLVAGIQKYALDRVKGLGFTWADEQFQSSKLLKWNNEYQPVSRIWASPPVKHFVDHVQRSGLASPASPEAYGGSVAKPLQANSGGPPRLGLPPAPREDFDSELTKAVESIERALKTNGPGSHSPN